MEVTQKGNKKDQVVDTPKKAGLPTLPISTLFAMTFGFFGVNMAFSLQSSQMGRIFQTIGADPTQLGFFFILPPLVGMIVQPLVGKYSDLTWTRFGRRMPYLLVGAPIAALVLVLLPNAGSFGFGYASLAALWFGAIAVLFMDLSSNVCMQPFKMIIGDMVNEDQKDFAWSWQQIFSNMGAILATLLPFVMTIMGVSNVAKKGTLPHSVIWTFYIGAAVLLLTSIFTIIKVREYNPTDYARYHGVQETDNQEKVGFVELLKDAPKEFWQISLVQMFCWFAFQYLWTYGTGAVAQNVWHVADPSAVGYQAAGNWFGVLSAVQAIAAVIWGMFLSKTKPNQRKMMYRLGLILGGIGFVSVFFIHIKLLLIVSFCLIGIGWITMNSVPFALLTTALGGKHEGAYLGLFNGSICLPQIIASVASFAIFPLIGKSMPGMILLAGVVFAAGSLFVGRIKETA